MKIIVSLFSLLFLPGITLAQSNTENYVESRTYLEPVTTSSASYKQVRTVQYFDGLGRPKQVVNVKASPLGKDVVIKIEYDSFGRQVKDYLPVPQQSTLNGDIYSDPHANATSVYGAEKIYAEKILESSPLDRILQQKQVGNDWNTHPVQFGYDANTHTEVKKYAASFNYTTFEATINLSGTYGENQLYKNSVTDEDGNVTIEFKNGAGQTVLVRKNDGTQNVDTYYVYNDYDQLAFVIPPLASVAPALDQTTLDNLCYQYKYDGRNRLVEKKLPGKGWEWMVYDQQDRLVATKDVQNDWLFTKYDMFGRVVYTGLADLGTSRQTVQQSLDNLQGAAASNNEARHSTGFYSGNMLVYYGNVSYPTGFTKVMSVNYYDTYPAGTPTIPATILTQAVLPQDAQNSSISTKSLPTASYVKNIEDDNWTKSYTWYDTKGRAIGSHTINHLGGFTKTESELDFGGAVQQNKTYHKRTAADVERTISESFTYDPQNRLLSQSHQVDSNPIEMLVLNTYNELSQLKEKSVGGGLQTVNYTYNIRGWITQINDPSALGNDLFGYKIRYNQVEGLETPNTDYMNLQVKPKYNGNIAEVDWKTSTDPNNYYRRYGYVYDALNRLGAGFYQSDANPSAKEYFEKLDYDANGNILALKRSAELSLSGFANNIDELTYTYSGNKLTSVTDGSFDYRGYPDSAGNTISYDNNGNMKNHVDKGILQIDYNFLNLPNYIKFSSYVVRNSENIHVNTAYLYRSDGVKLRKKYNFFSGRSQNNASQTMEYLDGFQYSSYNGVNGVPLSANGLQFIPTSEGYFDFVQNKYIYQYKDHLGNIRLSFYNDGTGNPAVDRTTDFYPFGLEFNASISSGTANENYKYGFQNQELQTETGWNSFKWRNYDPTLGRFFNVDPMSEKFQYNSTYAFQENKMGLGRELEGLELLQERGLITATGMIANDIYPKGPLPSYVISYLNYKSGNSALQGMDVADLPSGARGMGKWNNADGHFTSFAGEAKATKALGVFELIKQINTAIDAPGEIKAMGENTEAVKYIDKLDFQFGQMQTAQYLVNKADLKMDNKTKTEITNYVFDGSLPKDVNSRSNSIINLSSKSNIVNTANSIMRQNDIRVRNSPEVQKRQELEQQRMEHENKLQNVGR
ncbi:DUF6443 domain-containing protein [Chryseobacterium sp.]|uniref:DUF6443 domain-containing protein n=1 Tax=Chryseobacterium sp. TaxID=1871047 RepID=UPI0011C70A85|nr:DUF6443 domain-containing protein [Chryseobacterium sp.]TXF77774.1 RHS repeat-associated core domain-containing protein [Chryseobacterium sp.]